MLMSQKTKNNFQFSALNFSFNSNPIAFVLNTFLTEKPIKNVYTNDMAAYSNIHIIIHDFICESIVSLHGHKDYPIVPIFKNMLHCLKFYKLVPCIKKMFTSL